MANCLWSLGQSSPHTPVFREYVAITMGAYARYEAFDRRNADRHAECVKVLETKSAVYFV
jgi:hypothetical protein